MNIINNFKILDSSYTFGVALKVNPTEGNLVYEYNPFYNYRIDETMIYYKEELYTLEEFCEEYNTTEALIEEAEDGTWYDVKDIYGNEIIPATETIPCVYQAGQLVDFETDELNFSLNNPVNLLPQWSYDNSVNLIINDGLNPPRLINSRFSVTERNQYQVCNRKGDNDTNIYDRGEQFDVDTSLYRKITTIPELKFSGVDYGGNLAIGNYHFYFKYVDEDGNESDFFAESGLVSIFIGNTADSIYSGFQDENSHKCVKFTLSNTDPSYLKVLIYYTRVTSQVNQNSYTEAFKIDQNFYIADSDNTLLTITGYENKTQVSIDEINTQYQMYGAAETQCQCQNMLFLGNLAKTEVPYEDLQDCALRFLPLLNTEVSYNYESIDLDYSGNINNTYYDPSYIYNYVGYWDDEIYRFGIVYIMSDNTLSDVYNIRGLNNLSTEITYDSYSDIDFKDDEDNRVYINYDPQYYTIISGEGENSDLDLENAKGVVRIDHSDFDTIIGFNFIVKKEVIDYLKTELGIKGFFFVRQKRIPTTLCQAYIIGIDNQSYTPVLPMNGENDDGNSYYITEGFLTQDEDQLLDYDFKKRLIEISDTNVTAIGAICPEYDVDYPYLNTLFTGSELKVRNCAEAHKLIRNGRQFYPTDFSFEKASGYSTVKILGVQDDVKLAAINSNYFRTRAGEAEEAYRFEYAGEKTVSEDSTNYLRGSYGPILGITGYENPGSLVDIKIPGYSSSSMDDYFYIRYNDLSSYYAISDRIDISDDNIGLVLEEYNPNGDGSDVEAATYYSTIDAIYRGDCYICQFTHRVNRNFQDPTAPINDDIVDSECWADHYNVEDDVMVIDDFEDINLGDVNAIQLGMYVTLIVRSTYNLNIRALDGSYTEEVAMTGNERGFYPLRPLSGAGVYKIPEALCINAGLQNSLSERINIELPDVPWIKNEFSNRIAYSNIQVQDAFQNGWRTFMGTHYRDYPKTYGSITKIVEWGGGIICIFEHGIAYIAVNERALAGEGEGGYVYVNTSNVLPQNPKVISDTLGSQWRESIIGGASAAGSNISNYLYGVDTVAKKIWRTDGNTVEVISNYRVNEFLNNNITLSERELTPIIGVRNIKTHYNAWKDDIMFTFYDNLTGFTERVWNLCWNEELNKFITFYSWVPSYSENIYNQYFSFDRNTSKWIAKLGVSHYDNDFADGVTLTENEIPQDGIDGFQYISELHLSNRTLPESDNITIDIEYELERDNYLNYKNFEIATGIKETTVKYYKHVIVHTTEAGTKYYTYEYYKVEDTTLVYTWNDGESTKTVVTTHTVKWNGNDAEYEGSKDVTDCTITDEEGCIVTTTVTIDGKEQEDAGGESLYGDDEDAVDTLPSVDSVDDFPDNEEKTTTENLQYLKLKDDVEYTDLCSEFYVRTNSDGDQIYPTDDAYSEGFPDLSIYKNDKGRRIWLDQEDQVNSDKIVILLNIKANITVNYNGTVATLEEYLATGTANAVSVDAGYYESVVAVIPEYNMQFLTTDFWKHGYAGIIDIADKLYPTYWYGKQHPFEFEFVVHKDELRHKIFDNLIIISNNAEPESFHYEIIGDSFDFAEDKKNMYIRQEATKELYQYNGYDIEYDEDYADLESEHRPLDMTDSCGRQLYDKSTLFPLYYSRQDTINEIEDYYHLQDGANTKDFSRLAGAEIVHYDLLDEYRIWNHAKAVNMKDSGRLYGNMQYQEDAWYVQINPINLVQKNESTWLDMDGKETDKVPVELKQSPIPNDVIELQNLEIPDSDGWENRGYVMWRWNDSKVKEVKVKDKWVKIRIRYSGEKLAIISQINTIYTLSQTNETNNF